VSISISCFCFDSVFVLAHLVIVMHLLFIVGDRTHLIDNLTLN